MREARSFLKELSEETHFDTPARFDGFLTFYLRLEPGHQRGNLSLIDPAVGSREDTSLTREPIQYLFMDQVARSL